MKTLADALELAAKDYDFANKLVKDPDAFKAEYNISDAQIAEIKNIRASGVLRTGVTPDGINYETDPPQG